MRKRVGEREVILEFQRIGEYVKVTALDAETLTEVSAVGAASASPAELERLALSKLEYVLRKKPTPPAGGTRA